MGDTGQGGKRTAPPWWTMAIQAVGAAAGIAALTTFVGGAMLWLRFDGLDLPADRAVALLPRELLLVVGAQAMVVPLALGLGALLWLTVLDPLDRDGEIEPHFWWAFLPSVVLLVIAMFAFTADLDVPVIAIATVVGVLGVIAIVQTARRTAAVRNIAWVVFAVFVGLGAVVNVLHMRFEPEMEPVAALLVSGEAEAQEAEGGGESVPSARGLAGFFVGETDERLWFVSLPGNGDPGDPFADAAVDRVVGIPRDQVTRIAMRAPAGVRADEPGREQAHTLLADLQVSVTGREEAAQPVTTTLPEVAFAPLVHLHADERWLPMSARGFVDQSVLYWANRGGDCDRVAIAAGRHTEAAAEGRLARIRAERLARADPYEHRQSARCGPRAGTFRSDQLTRPYAAGKPRPAGLARRQGFYLDLDDSVRGGRGEVDDEGPQSYLRNVPVYVESQDAPLSDDERAQLPDGETATGGLVLTYWMLYGLSEPPGPSPAMRAFVHEGDWERISVRIAKLGPEDSDRYLPLSARYHYHEHSREIPWYAVRRVVGGTGVEQGGATHPVVYSAEGSHASYWRAGRYEAVYEPGGRRLLAVHDDAITCPECPQWHTWKLTRPVRGELWYGFGGAWGKVGASAATTGPLGPSRYKLSVPEDPTTVLVGGDPPVPSAPTEVEETGREE